MPFETHSTAEVNDIFDSGYDNKFAHSVMGELITDTPTSTYTPTSQSEKRKRKATVLNDITNTQEGGGQSTPGSSKRQFRTLPKRENFITDQVFFQLQNQEPEFTPITTPASKKEVKEDKVFKISAQTQDVLCTNNEQNGFSLNGFSLRRSSRVLDRKAKQAQEALVQQIAQEAQAAQAAQADATYQAVMSTSFRPHTPLVPATQQGSPMSENAKNCADLCSPDSAVKYWNSAKLTKEPESSEKGFQRTDVDSTIKALKFSKSI